MHELYISLGTNLGDKRRNILLAIQKIQESIGTVARQSTLIATDPVGFHSDNQFLNAAILVHTHLSPQECLRITQDIERQMGRTHKSVNNQYQDRIIDIDLLLYDDLKINTPTLTLPHPRMYQRDFVLRPLKEIYCFRE